MVRHYSTLQVVVYYHHRTVDCFSNLAHMESCVVQCVSNGATLHRLWLSSKYHSSFAVIVYIYFKVNPAKSINEIKAKYEDQLLAVRNKSDTPLQTTLPNWLQTDFLSAVKFTSLDNSRNVYSVKIN